MKTLILNPKSITSLLIVTGLVICMSSCKKDSTTTTIAAVTDDEVAEAVTESVSGSSAGLATQTETTAIISTSSPVACGFVNDTTISGESAAGAPVTYSYNLSFNSSVSCANGLPSEFDFNFSGKSSYTALRMSSNDSTNAHFSETGLLPSAKSYLFNVNYVRNGTQQSSVRLKRAITSTITITATDITVDKSTQKIISGTATVQFVGTVTGGASTTRGGTVTFLGSGQATIVLDNGSSYPIQW